MTCQHRTAVPNRAGPNTCRKGSSAARGLPAEWADVQDDVWKPTPEFVSISQVNAERSLLEEKDAGKAADEQGNKLVREEDLGRRKQNQSALQSKPKSSIPRRSHLAMWRVWVDRHYPINSPPTGTWI